MTDTQTIVDLVTRHHEDMEACLKNPQRELFENINMWQGIDTQYAKELSVATGKTPEACEMLTRVCNNYSPIIRDHDLKTALVRCFLGYPVLWEKLLEANHAKNQQYRLTEQLWFDEMLQNIKTRV